MFDLPRHKIIVPGLVDTVENLHVILEDENRILYTGTNRLGNHLIGAIIQQDFSNKVFYYYHAIVESPILYDFLGKRMNLKDTLRNSSILTIVTTDFNYKVIDYALINFEEIPEEYLPYETSFCPDIARSGSFEYCFSLKGKASDEHKVDVGEAGEADNKFQKILESALATMKDLPFNSEYFKRPAMAGSYKTNFLIEIKDSDNGLFPVDTNFIAEYLEKYLDYVVAKLPFGDETTIEQVLKSNEVQDIKLALEEVYYRSQHSTDEDKIEAVLAKSIHHSAQVIKQMAESLNEKRSFDRFELSAVNPDATQREIGQVDITYAIKVEPKFQSDFINQETFEKVVEADAVPKAYRIQVRGFYVKSGIGIADFYPDASDEHHPIRIYVASAVSLQPSVYTKSLNEPSIVTIFGKAERINGKVKRIRIDHADNIDLHLI